MCLRIPMVFALLLACTHAETKKAPLGPPTGVAVFSRFSKFAGARISPGGVYLAADSVENGRHALAFIDLRTRKLASIFRPLPQSVASFVWVSDDRVLVELAEDFGTLERPELTGEISAVNPATGNGVTIFGARAVKNATYAWGTILSRLRGDDRHVLIETGHFFEGVPREAQLYKLDVYTGQTTPVTVGPMPAAEFVTDEDGEPRIAAAQTIDVKPKFFYRDAGGAWTELTNLKGVAPRSRPVGFVARTRTLTVVERLEKGFGLFATNIDTGARKLLSQNDWSPPGGYLRDRNTREILAAEYDADVPTWDFIAPDHPLSRVVRGLLDANPAANVRLLNATDDEKTAVVYVYSDREPGRFYLVDVAQLSAEEIVAARPWTKPAEMAEMNAFHIKASDGLWIHGYITLPRNHSGPSPMVVVPHGGPHGVRDSWGFHPETQLLASEGFAVLQVNFRGSGGYGEPYQEAGYHHWGDRMMLDIADATRWAISKGHADGARVCIYGASFGGYSALQAPIAAPGLFRCAAGYAGVYDLPLLKKSGDVSESRLGRGFLDRVLGEDEEQLKSMSPAYHAGQLKLPVFLIHGKKDQRAPFDQFKAMKKALEEAGNPPLTLVEPDEGHGFYDEEARERMYVQLLKFLHSNLDVDPAARRSTH